MKFEIEVDDKGEFVGGLPTELDTILKRIETTAHGAGFGKGAQKAAEEAKAQIAAAVAAEKARLEAEQPLQKAKWDEIDQQNKHLRAQLESTSSETRKRMTEREEAHATEITRRMDDLKRRDEKIRTLVNGQLRVLAASAGARDESLSELEVILQHRIGYDDHMEPYVKAEDGTPAKTAAGNPLGIDAFVKQYLDNHPHHRKPDTRRGGGAPGGMTLRGHAAVASSTEAVARIHGGDRSATAINDLYEATRKRA